MDNKGFDVVLIGDDSKLRIGGFKGFLDRFKADLQAGR